MPRQRTRGWNPRPRAASEATRGRPPGRPRPTAGSRTVPAPDEEGPMRKIVVGMFVSLDGVMEGPGPADEFALAGWTMPYWDADVAQFVDASMSESDTLLLGRITYEGFAAAFGDAPADNPDAATMNGFTKYVVSTDR